MVNIDNSINDIKRLSNKTFVKRRGSSAKEHLWHSQEWILLTLGIETRKGWDLIQLARQASLHVLHMYWCWFMVFFPIQSFISLGHTFFLHDSRDKRPKQNSSIWRHKTTFTAIRSQEPLRAVNQRDFLGALLQGFCAYWVDMYCVLYFLAFDWLRSAVLFFLNSPFLSLWRKVVFETIQINP